MTSSQWFETQHVQPKPQACNSAMGHVNKFTEHCKNLNTFLHESFSNVATTCQTPQITCKNNHENCHQSPGPVSLTMCTLTSGKYPNCRTRQQRRSGIWRPEEILVPIATSPSSGSLPTPHKKDGSGIQYRIVGV
ncbi:Hypothetical predicted protein [Marmota monax]|uniref:Ribonuclease A-domain domain-containing protein n=1 Tax=Marmota monax TaxID=9995 RepID=A0A5E4BR96_MARMO|nr:hypothetical protein GHT09_008164 [Marmota monax]VTJ72097.1 Hypothetical predicted protein [Marmota monax]